MRNQEFKIDIGVGAFSFLIGLAALILSKDMPGRASMFPRVVSVLFMVIGIAMALTSWHKIRTNAESKKAVMDADLFRGPLIVLGLLLIYIIAMPRIGFYVSTLVMLVCYMRILGIKSWKTIALVTVIVMAFIFGLFTLGLAIPLPTGILR